jgi:hypothetical protein
LAPFLGSTGAIALNKPITGMEAASSGGGYRFVASDGGIFYFGSESFLRIGCLMSCHLWGLVQKKGRGANA